MQASLKFMLQQLPDVQADKGLVQTAAAAMAARLEEKRAAGRGGWHGPDCSIQGLQQILQRKLAAGAMVDVMNLAAMIHVRHELFGEVIAAPAAESRLDGYQHFGDGAGRVTLDLRTGLMWGPTLGKMDHARAQEACRELRLLGYSDWRLPQRSELYTIISDTETNPAVPKGHFEDTKSDYYWTATAVPGFPDYFRVVYFNGGGVDSSLQGDDAFVRPVRVASLPAGQ